MALTSLQVELFVADLDASRDFYERVLSFSLGERQPDGYTPLQSGPVQMSLNDRATISGHHPIHIGAGDRPGRGVELVLWVDDLSEMYARVKRQGWPIYHEMARQPWGLDDFRLQDPDGYYLRITAQPNPDG